MKGDNPKGWRDFGTSGANCCRVKNCRCCSLKVEQRVRHLLHRLHQRVAKGSRYSYIPVMCVYNNWVIKLLILRLHFRLISGWRGNNPTREKMRTLVSLSYNMAKVVLIVEPERITLFPPIASLFCVFLVGWEYETRWRFSLTTKHLLLQSRGWSLFIIE